MSDTNPKRQPPAPLALWVIKPVAARDDPAWMDRRQFESVIVRAESPALARELASALDTPATAVGYGQQEPTEGSAFNSPRLYHVLPVDGVKSALDGPPEVIDYTVRNMTSR